MYQFNYLRTLQLRRAANDPGGTPPADDPGKTPPADDPGKPGDKPGGEDKPGGDKSFTQADVDEIVRKTIAKERARAEKAVESAKTEAEKLATMTAEQRAAHEQQEREANLAAREAEINRRELRATALQTLAEKQLPAELAEVLDYTDADKCSASITGMEKAFRAAVQKGVEERLKGNPPSAGGTGTKPVEKPANLQAAVGDYYKKG